MEQSDRIIDDVETLDVDESENKPTEAKASFTGKLDLSSYSYSRSSSLRSARKPSSIRQLNKTVEGDGNKQDEIPTPLKKQTAAAITPRRPIKRKKSSGYAPPSTYAHLQPLPDTLQAGLICVFIGLNPGIQTAETGHAYAHPSNYFWHLLWKSNLTPSPSKLPPSYTSLLPSLYSLGNTNIVSRPSRNGAELKQSELDAGVSILEAKIREFRPEAVCIVGKSIWESIFRVKQKRKLAKEEFKYGWQEGERMGVVENADEDGTWEGAKVFVATTTSALAAGMKMSEKEEIWMGIGDWVQERRAERAALNSQ